MNSVFPYHVFARANNKDWFGLPLGECWKVFEEKLAIVSERYSAQVISFVLLVNHFHMLMRTPNANLDEIMNYLMRETSREIARRLGRINHIFGGRYKGCVITQSSYFYHVYKYVYRNPVEAGSCLRVEDYPFSTLQQLVNRTQFSFPVHDDIATNLSPIPKWPERLEWLNGAPSAAQTDFIRRALRHAEFKPPGGHNFTNVRTALAFS